MSSQGMLDKKALEQFLLKREPKLAHIVARFTGDLANAITYEQVRAALISGDVDEAWLQKLRVAYSKFIVEVIAPQWQVAISEGGTHTPLSPTSQFVFDPAQAAVKEWARNRAADLVVNIGDQQQQAIRALVDHAISAEGMSVDELAMAIRPVVGLYPAQMVANARYYNMVKSQLIQNHPKTKIEVVEARAQKAALKYAEVQHRARAAMIARTELVTAYNAGRYHSVGQMVEQGFLGQVEKVWVTALDDRVCDHCKALEGKRVAYDAPFVLDGKARYSDGLFPPLHPRCRCVVTYEQMDQG